MFSTLMPPEGTKTVWEDRCILVHLDNAQDVTGAAKLMPSVLLADELPVELMPSRPAVYPPDAIADGGEDGSGRASLLERLASHLQAAVSPFVLGGPLAFVWSNFLSGCQPRAAAPPLEWHPRRPLLAAADARGRVQVVDLDPSRQPPANGLGRPELLVAGPGSLVAVLTHEALHHQALSLAWCPTSPGLLAVGAAGAVGLWAMVGEGRPPLTAAGRSSGPWLRLLRTRVAGARLTGLSWSPDGRLLAAASPNQAGLQLWDVASGTPTTVSAGPAAFDTVRWSPCGKYVFAAGTGSRHFYIFETQRWRWARWQTASSSAGAGGAGAGAAGPTSVVAAVWAPPAAGRNPILLAALSGQSYLVAVHLVDAPPSLTAQLLPVALPELFRATRSGAGSAAAAPTGTPSSASSSAPSITDLAWDPRGERLAVLLAPAGPQAGGQDTHCVALYSTITDPLVSARLIGLARPPQRLCTAAAAAASPAGGQAAASRSTGPVPEAAATSETAAPLNALPGALAAARLAPLGGSTAGPACVISARVGQRGIYNLPCFF